MNLKQLDPVGVAKFVLVYEGSVNEFRQRMAEHFGVSMSTVKHELPRLVEAGILEQTVLQLRGAPTTYSVPRAVAELVSTGSLKDASKIRQMTRKSDLDRMVDAVKKLMGWDNARAEYGRQLFADGKIAFCARCVRKGIPAVYEGTATDCAHGCKRSDRMVSAYTQGILPRPAPAQATLDTCNVCGGSRESEYHRLVCAQPHVVHRDSSAFLSWQAGT